MDNVIGYFIIWAGCAVVAYIIGQNMLVNGGTLKQNVGFSIVVGTIIFVVALAIFTGDGGTPPSVEYSR